VTLNFLKHVPVSNDPCGRLQYGIPNNSTEHQGLGKVDYTISANQSLFARYFYAVYDNPATYDGSNVLTLSRTGQNNQAHSLVVGHNLVISSSTLNSCTSPTTARSTTARCRRISAPPTSGRASRAWCRVMSASASPATVSPSARAPLTRATSTRRAGRSRTTSI
jgi:hypothetical protein